MCPKQISGVKMSEIKRGVVMWVYWALDCSLGVVSFGPVARLAFQLAPESTTMII